MADRYVAAEAAVRDLVGWLASWTWPLDQPAVMARVAERGWTVVDEEPEAGADWDTGLITHRPRASASVVKGLVSGLTVATARVRDEEPESRRLIQDGFADQVAVVTEVLGPPRSRKPGSAPSVEWDLPSGASLKVLHVERSCSWVLTSPKFVEIRRDLER